PADRLARILDVHRPAVTLDRARVADLPARLDVERRDVQHDLDVVAHARALDHLAVAQDGEHPRLAGQRAVLLLLHAAIEQAAPAQRGQRGAVRLAHVDRAEGALARAPADLLVARLGRAEARLVHAEALFLRDVARDLQRQALLGVQAEG